MPELTTTDGRTFWFTSDAVVLVADHDERSGDAVTTVYGVAPGLVTIAESPSALFTRLGLGGQLAQLTRPDAAHVWVRGSAVSGLRAPFPGELDPAVRSVVTAGGFTQGVTEDVATVRSAVNAHGGHL